MTLRTPIKRYSEIADYFDTDGNADYKAVEADLGYTKQDIDVYLYACANGEYPTLEQLELGTPKPLSHFVSKL